MLVSGKNCEEDNSSIVCQLIDQNYAPKFLFYEIHFVWFGN